MFIRVTSVCCAIALTQLAQAVTEVDSRVEAEGLKLPSKLTEQIQFLRFGADSKDDILGVVERNDLADVLLQESGSQVPTAKVLIEVIRDVNSDVLWRDYCLQKLALAYRADEMTEELRSQILETLRAMVRNPLISCSGTSLLGLYHLRDFSFVSDDELIKAANVILDGKEFATANKVTALQVAVLLHDKDALTRAREWTADSHAPIQLRSSAIAAIAGNGDSGDLRLIQPLFDSRDFRLRYAARAAEQKLK